MEKVLYSFDFTGIENDTLVQKFCKDNPEFINKLKSLPNKGVDRLWQLYDSLYEIKDLGPFVDWGYYMQSYSVSVLDMALANHDPEDKDKIRLVYHLVNRYLIKTYPIEKNNKTWIRFSTGNKYITLRDLYEIINN